MENIVLTAHICVLSADIGASDEIIHQIQHVLHEDFDVIHSTIQVEQEPCGSCYHSKPDHIEQCILWID